jgi:hypothetical protein
MVEASFFGEHYVKGKPEWKKAYRLDAIREGATRFGAKLHHGLTTFVGRDPELEKLERGFDAIRSSVQVFDIVGAARRRRLKGTSLPTSRLPATPFPTSRARQPPKLSILKTLPSAVMVIVPDDVCVVSSVPTSGVIAAS